MGAWSRILCWPGRPRRDERGAAPSGGRGDGPARADGFAAIKSYGIIGDGESVALIGRDDAIDWWAVPAIDSPPVLAAVLDPRDGGGDRNYDYRYGWIRDTSFVLDWSSASA